MTPVFPRPATVSPAGAAGRIRDRATVLFNTLEMVRIKVGGDAELDMCLDLAVRQTAALVALADELHTPGTAGSFRHPLPA